MHVKPLLLALILTAATSANADPVQVTSGSVLLQGPCDCSIAFDLRFDQLRLTGQAFDERGEDLAYTVRPSPNPPVTGRWQICPAHPHLISGSDSLS